MRTRWIAAGIVAGALLAGGGPALAQQPAAGKPGESGQVKSKFYNFEDMLIDGEYKKPGALLTNARDQAKFERLFRLRKSFMPVMLQTSKEPALRR